MTWGAPSKSGTEQKQSRTTNTTEHPEQRYIDRDKPLHQKMSFGGEEEINYSFLKNTVQRLKYHHISGTEKNKYGFIGHPIWNGEGQIRIYTYRSSHLEERGTSTDS